MEAVYATSVKAFDNLALCAVTPETVSFNVVSSILLYYFNIKFWEKLVEFSYE